MISFRHLFGVFCSFLFICKIAFAADSPSWSALDTMRQKVFADKDVNCVIRSGEYDYLKTFNILFVGGGRLQKNMLQLHCSNKEKKIIFKIPIKLTWMLNIGPQIGLIAGFAGGGMKDIYFKLDNFSTQKIHKIAGSYYGMKAGLDLFMVGVTGDALVNKHGVRLYGLEYALPYPNLRISTEGLGVMFRTFKLKFRKADQAEENDPLVVVYE